ncbi:dihydrofolate reductase-like domain-containing protein, partial [Dimargaris cristalligena]
PSVTLTYAQSLDGKIAGPRGQQLILSGPQSMAMTHQLRTTHDAILVGVQTVLNDNPRLTARMCAPNTPLENPQPVILDSTLKTPLSCALMTARFDNPAAKLPWILTTGQYNLDSKILLEGAGARIFIIDELPAPTDHPDNNSHDHNNGHGNGNNSRIISVKSILQCLGTNGIRRVMVEGGARVIDQFLTYAATTPIRKTQQSNRPDVRCIITVAPKWVGPEG